MTELGVEEVPRRRTFFTQNPPRVRELFVGDGATRKGVFLRGDHDHFVFHPGFGYKFRVPYGPFDERRVEFKAHELFGNALRVGDFDARNPTETVFEAAQKFRDHEGPHRTGAPHAERGCALAVRKKSRDVLRARHHFVRLGHQAPAFGREENAAAVAVEKMHAQACLQFAERLRDGTLAHVEVARGVPDVFRLGNRKEDLKLPQGYGELRVVGTECGHGGSGVVVLGVEHGFAFSSPRVSHRNAARARPWESIIPVWFSRIGRTFPSSFPERPSFLRSRCVRGGRSVRLCSTHILNSIGSTEHKLGKND